MAGDAPPLRLFKPGDTTKLEPRKYVIGGVLACGESMLLHGSPKGGKSALMVSAACCVGTGSDFFGHRVRRGLVIYILAERTKETDRRLQAVLGNDHPGHLVRFVRARLLGERNNIANLIDIIQSEGARTGEPVLLLIFDTAVSLLRDGGGDENSQRDVSKLTDAIDKIRGATGGAAILVHHSKRGERRPKGSEVLEAWAETIASVSTIHKTADRKLEIERSNTTEPGIKARFALEPVDLGEDEETGARSQVVIAVPSEATTKSSGLRPTRLAPDVEMAFSELKKLEEPIGVEDWRSSVMVAFASKPSQSARRVAFFNAKRKLEDEGLIAIDGETVSVSEAS